MAKAKKASGVSRRTSGVRLAGRLSLSPEMFKGFEEIVLLDISKSMEEIDWNAVLRDLLRKPVRVVNEKPKVKTGFLHARRSAKSA